MAGFRLTLPTLHRVTPLPTLQALEPFFSTFDKDYLPLRERMSKVLQREADLEEIVQLVGKDSLGEVDKVVLDVASIIKEDFLAQNAFSDYDYYCPLNKTIGMMRCIVTFFVQSINAIKESSSDAKVTMALIMNLLRDEYNQLSVLKMEKPEQPKEELDKKFQNLINSIEKKFRSISK